MKKNFIVLSLISLVLFSNGAVYPKDEIKETRAAKVTKNDIFLFIDCEPSNDYEIIGTVKSAAIIKNYKSSYLVAHMKKRAKEKFKDCEGLILSTSENLVSGKVIKFKK